MVNHEALSSLRKESEERPGVWTVERERQPPSIHSGALEKDCVFDLGLSKGNMVVGMFRSNVTSHSTVHQQYRVRKRGSARTRWLRKHTDLLQKCPDARPPRASDKKRLCTSTLQPALPSILYLQMVGSTLHGSNEVRSLGHSPPSRPKGKTRRCHLVGCSSSPRGLCSPSQLSRRWNIFLGRRC